MSNGNSGEIPTFAGQTATFLALLIVFAGFAGGLIFFVMANNVCPSYRACDLSETILKRSHITMAVYSVVGGIISGAVLAVLGEISQHLAAVRELLSEPDE